MVKKAKKTSFLTKVLAHQQPLLLSLFFLFTTGLYLHNLTRDIYSGDVGDLVTASYVFGVAHPPGYPLFTLLGFIFSHLPIPLPIVSRVGLISVFSSLLALYLYYKLALRLTKHFYISLLSTTILAFSHLFWVHAELPEVFGLNHLFVIAILYTAIIFYQEKKIKYFYLLGFLTGLSLTHHHTILFILPVALILTLRHFKLIFSNWKIPCIGIGCLLLGLVPYIYVPIAASQNPIVNWDHASTWKGFLHLVLRQDYGSTAPPVVSDIPPQIKLTVVKDYLVTLLNTFSYQIVFIALLGIIGLFRKDKWILFSLLLGFFLSGPFFIYYAARPITSTAAWGIIERMYSFSFLLFTILIPIGFYTIKEFFDKKFPNKIYGKIILTYFLIIPLFMLYYNFPKTDLSKTQVGYNLAIDILHALPQDSLLFISGDTTTFNIWYAHYVLNIRPDVGVINPPGVGGSNYLDEKINEYKKLHPQTDNKKLVVNTLEDLRKTRRVFGTYELSYQPNGTALIPYGLVYELTDIASVPPKEEYLYRVESQLRKLHILRRDTLLLRDSNMIAGEIPLIYSNALVRTGDFLISQYKDYAKAEHYYRRALWIDDENPSGYSGLSLSQFNANHDCTNAISNMKEAISLYNIWKTYYLQLYSLYHRCEVNEEEIESLKNDYKTLFNEDPDIILKKNSQPKNL